MIVADGPWPGIQAWRRGFMAMDAVTTTHRLGARLVRGVGEPPLLPDEEV